MIKADNNTEVLHQLAAIAEFLEKHGYAKIAKKIQKSLKKDLETYPPKRMASGNGLTAQVLRPAATVVEMTINQE